MQNNNNKKAGNLILHDFIIYYKAIVIKTVWDTVQKEMLAYTSN